MMPLGRINVLKVPAFLHNLSKSLGNDPVEKGLLQACSGAACPFHSRRYEV